MGNLDKRDIGGRQQMIMRCLWDLGGSGIVSQIREQIEKEYGEVISGQGLNTSLNLMMERGLVIRRRKIRQSFIYQCTMSEQEFRKSEIERVRKNAFRGSSVDIVRSLLEAGMTDEEKEEIVSLLRTDKTLE